MTDAWGSDDPGGQPRGWASLGAIMATVLLVALVGMVTWTNGQRESALETERHAYQVALLAQTLDSSIARAEGSLGRYVLDEKALSATQYYNEWRIANRQLGQLRRLVNRNPEQHARVARLDELFRQRGEELARAVVAAAGKTGSGGVPYFYQASLSPTGPALSKSLDDIASAERATLRQRMAETQSFGQTANDLTGWLGWIGVLVGIGAIGLGVAAYRALGDGQAAREEADSEGQRALALDLAVQQRTRELSDANERLRLEASERAAAEAALRQAQKMEAVGQLTGGIAHDFNNMLAVIVGGVDLARRKLAGTRSDVDPHLANAMEGATRAAALTRRLLAFARSEPVRAEHIATGGLIANMLDLVDRSMGERIKVETEIAADAWPVLADPNQLESAILNLCVNARDAMDGEGVVRIALDNLVLNLGEAGNMPPGDYARFTIADDGAGIAPEHLDRVFEPFFTTKPVGKGTGLGLSQIFAFARRSGGDVRIESEPGKGTKVFLLLPRAMSAPGTATVETPRPAHAEPHGTGFTRILVVEDDPRVSRATVGALEELDYVPVACASGKEALALLERDSAFAMVMSDVMMPEMTGPELAREIEARFPHLPILFVTGFVGETNEADALQGYGMLRKPFTIAALADAVGDTLSGSASGLPPAARDAAAG